MIKLFFILSFTLVLLLTSCSDKNAGTSTNTGTTIASSSDSTLQTDEPLTIKVVNAESDTNTLYANQLQSEELVITDLPKNESFKLKLHYEFRRAFDYQIKNNSLEATLIDSGTILNNNIFWSDDSLDYPCVLTLSTNIGQKHLSKVFYNLNDLQSSPDLFSLMDTVQVKVDPIKIPEGSSPTWVGFLGSSSFMRLNETTSLLSSSFSDLSKLIIINDLENPSIASFNPNAENSTYLIPTQSTLQDSVANLKFSIKDNLEWEVEFTIEP